MQEHFTFVAPSLWNNLLPSLHSTTAIATLKKGLQTHLFDLAPPPPIIDTSTLDGPLMLRNCFVNYAVEHWFGCHATKPGYAGDTGIIEISLIDWHSCMYYVMLAKLNISKSYDTIIEGHIEPSKGLTPLVTKEWRIFLPRTALTNTMLYVFHFNAGDFTQVFQCYSIYLSHTLHSLDRWGHWFN